MTFTLLTGCCALGCLLLVVEMDATNGLRFGLEVCLLAYLARRIGALT